MAGVEVESVVVNMSGGRLGARTHAARLGLNGAAVTEGDAHRVLTAAAQAGADPGRVALHLIPRGFSLDAQRGVADPRGMIGDFLGGETQHSLVRRLGGAQSDACDRALPSARRRHRRVALCGGPVDAGRRRGGTGRGADRFRRRRDHHRRLRRGPARACRFRAGRRPSRDDGHRARALDQPCRRRADEDDARRLHARRGGRARDAVDPSRRRREGPAGADRPSPN